MTNREWLNSLSDKELSTFLCDLADYGCGVVCKDYCGCNGFGSSINCEKKVIEWLQKSKEAEV